MVVVEGWYHTFEDRIMSTESWLTNHTQPCRNGLWRFSVVCCLINPITGEDFIGPDLLHGAAENRRQKINGDWHIEPQPSVSGSGRKVD